MTPATGGPRLSPTRIQRLRLAAYIFCGVLTLWLVVSVISSVILGLYNDLAHDPFTGQPVRTPSGPAATGTP